MQTQAMFSSASQEWETPGDLFAELNARFNFTLDVCASAQNYKCRQYFDKERDGLKQDWGPNRCFMNPPYGREIGAWVKKAADEAALGVLVVGLLPARTDTAWWHNWVQPFADIRFIRGRLRFEGAKNAAPFPSAIAVWWGWGRNDGWFAEP